MKTALLTFFNGVYSLVIKLGTLTGNLELTLPTAAPTAGQVLRAQSGNPTQLEWATVATGGGTVTSVAVSAPANEFNVTGSPIATNGTIALAWKNQAQNTVLAAPVSGGAGAPGFRALAAADIPVLDAGKITTGTLDIARIPTGTTGTTVALGNDSRFHTQNTDTGTSSTTFQLNNSGSGVKLKDVAGALALRNPADNAYADIIVNNLTVQGTQTIVNSNQVDIGDNIINLNSDWTGAPSQDAGFTVNRGSSTAANFLWSESKQRFTGGIAGSEKDFLQYAKQDITNADLTGGSYTWAHGLNRKPVLWAVWDNNGDGILIQPNAVNVNTMTFTFTGMTLSGTWTLVAAG